MAVHGTNSYPITTSNEDLSTIPWSDLVHAFSSYAIIKKETARLDSTETELTKINSILERAKSEYSRLYNNFSQDDFDQYKNLLKNPSLITQVQSYPCTAYAPDRVEFRKDFALSISATHEAALRIFFNIEGLKREHSILKAKKDNIEKTLENLKENLEKLPYQPETQAEFAFLITEEYIRRTYAVSPRKESRRFDSSSLSDFGPSFLAHLSESSEKSNYTGRIEESHFYALSSSEDYDLFLEHKLKNGLVQWLYLPFPTKQRAGFDMIEAIQQSLAPKERLPDTQLLPLKMADLFRM